MRLLPGAASPLAMGLRAGGLLRLDGLLVSDGIGARCWLMLLPVLLGSRTAEAADHMAGRHHMPVASPLADLLATAFRTAACVTEIIAWVVYSKFGLAILRKAWLNLNLVRAAALVVTRVLTLRM